MPVSGYTYCSCRDCMEIVIGYPKKKNLCPYCKEAGCDEHPRWPNNECLREDFEDLGLVSPGSE